MKAIVFDLDDTLYDEKQFVYGAFREVAEYISYKYKLNGIDLYNQMINILHNMGRGKIFDIIIKDYNLKEDVISLVEIYRMANPKLRLYDDALFFLKKYSKVILLGLITDGLHYVQRNKVQLLGIERYFNSILITDEYGKHFWKPSKECYLKMARDLNVDTMDMIYIGDNPHKDFYNARKLGIKTIRLRREKGDYRDIVLDREHEADFTASHFGEVEEMLFGYSGNEG